MDHIWQQINVHYPGQGPQEREQHAIKHLGQVLPAAESAGLITSWWFIRKKAWRIRYLPTEKQASRELAHKLITDGADWTGDIYEPETDAFGGSYAVDTAHTLFHHDSRHLLAYLQQQPSDQRERSLILCTAMMRGARLDLNEQGDVWAKVVEHRSEHLNQQLVPDAITRKAFTDDVHQLLLGFPHTTSDWHTAFQDAGARLHHLREAGKLTRGLRAVIALHVIFHWNRIGIPAAM